MLAADVPSFTRGYLRRWRRWPGVAGLGAMARRREYLTATVVLAIIACVWFWPLLTGEQLGQSYRLGLYAPWAAAADAESLPERGFLDAALQFHPWAEVAGRQLADGHLPLWNPYEWAGTTLIGNMQSALLFPLTWPLLVFPFGYAWGAVALAKLVLAGLGAYALSRELRIVRGGALVAGTVYMLSGPLMFYVQWPHSSVFALFPWLLLASTRLLRRRTPGSVAAVGLAVGVTLLAGHPESALNAFSAAGVYVIVLLALDRRAGGRGSLAAAGFWLAGAVLGVAIAAVVVIPFLQALGPSLTKSQHGFELPGGTPLAGLLQYVMPMLLGRGEPTLFGWPFGYFGLPALILALVGFWRARAQPPALALVAMAAVTLLAVHRVFPFGWFVEHVPPWSSSLVNEQGTGFIVALAGAVGAAFGVGALLRHPLPLRRAAMLLGLVSVAIAVGLGLAELADALYAPATLKRQSVALTAVLLIATAVVLAALGRLKPGVALAITIAVSAASVADFHNLNVVLPADRAYPPKPPAIAAIQGQPGLARMAVIRQSPADLALPPNTPSLYELESIEGYDYPRSLRTFDLQKALRFSPALVDTRIARRPPLQSEIESLRMMNVAYYLAAPGAEPPDPSFRTFYEGPDAIVFQDPQALPRAYVVPRVLRTSDAAALAALQRGSLDARRLALVPQDAPRTASSAEARFRGARVEQLAPDHVRVHLPRGAAGWLVLAAAYSPAWKAEVDGREAKLWPTNVAAMGVPVSASARTVDFRLDRTMFWLGAGITLAALVIAAMLAASGRLFGSAPRRGSAQP